MDDVELAFRVQEEIERVRAENRRKYSLIFIETLTELNQPKEKIIDILVRSVGQTESEARNYYQAAMAKKN